MKKSVKTEVLQGEYVNLREVELSDAAFILMLRTNEKKSRFIHKTENNLDKQVEYSKRYKTLDDEYYFIIERKNGQPVGTICLYDLHETRCTPGSWLASDEATPAEVLESDLLLKRFAFDYLGMQELYFDVRKRNKSVVKHHRNWGSEIVGENEVDYFFALDKGTYETNKAKFLKLLILASR